MPLELLRLPAMPRRRPAPRPDRAPAAHCCGRTYQLAPSGLPLAQCLTCRQPLRYGSTAPTLF